MKSSTDRAELPSLSHHGTAVWRDPNSNLTPRSGVMCVGRMGAEEPAGAGPRVAAHQLGDHQQLIKPPCASGPLSESGGWVRVNTCKVLRTVPGTP